MRGKVFFIFGLYWLVWVAPPHHFHTVIKSVYVRLCYSRYFF